MRSHRALPLRRQTRQRHSNHFCKERYVVDLAMLAPTPQVFSLVVLVPFPIEVAYAILQVRHCPCLMLQCGRGPSCCERAYGNTSNRRPGPPPARLPVDTQLQQPGFIVPQSFPTDLLGP